MGDEGAYEADIKIQSYREICKTVDTLKKFYDEFQY
jgi:hypothetical protein